MQRDLLPNGQIQFRSVFNILLGDTRNARSVSVERPIFAREKNVFTVAEISRQDFRK